MIEDEVYRSTTQYRLWSYTDQALASLRSTTNSRAAARVRDAIRRLRLERESSSKQHGQSGQIDQSDDIDCLTVEEEQKLVGFYCVKAMDFADFCEFPTNVKVCEMAARLFTTLEC